MNELIRTFLGTQTNLSICTAINNIPYCANCFYVLDHKSNSLILKSNKQTRHIEEATKNKNVAGTILPDQLQLGKIKGVQFSGHFILPDEEELSNCKMLYYGKYPYARVISGDLWKIEITELKMTDNTLGFGKKLIWKRQD